MEDIEELIKQFLFPVEEVVYSTGVEKVDPSSLGSLFNVIGSSDDPKINGKSWKQLFLKYFPDADECYVKESDPLVSGTTHPEFTLGGHVCTGSSREIGPTEVCYLMPLCSAHNNSNKYEFTSYDIPILELKGYMTDEPAFTFIARMENALPFSIVFAQGMEWYHKNISEEVMSKILETNQLEALGFGELERYAILRRDNSYNGISIYSENFYQ